MKAIIIAGIATLTIGLIVIVTYISTNNNEVRLRNQAAAQEQANEAIYDNVWKTISQQAQISQEYRDSFAKIWKDIISARYENARGGALMSFIKEHNPELSIELYKKLMVTVESERKEFLNNQKKLIDIKREHDNIRTTFPSSLIVGNRPELDITIVTSTKAKEVFENRIDDDVKVFPQKAKENK